MSTEKTKQPAAKRSPVVRANRQYQPAVNLNLNVRGLPESATLEINERSAELTRQGRHVYRLGLGQSPFPVPEPIVEELKVNAHQKDYLPVKGLPALRAAIQRAMCGGPCRRGRPSCRTSPSTSIWR